MALDLIDIFATYFLNASGNLVDQRIVKFGSGAGPKLSNVCKKRKELFVTNGRPSSAIPPIDSVTQVGSPLYKSLYSGVLANLTRRSFIIKWSTNCCASFSVKVPFCKSLSI